MQLKLYYFKMNIINELKSISHLKKNSHRPKKNIFKPANGKINLMNWISQLESFFFPFFKLKEGVGRIGENEQKRRRLRFGSKI